MEISPTQKKMDQVVAELSDGIEDMSHNSDTENAAEPAPVLSEQEKMDQIIAELSNNIDEMNHDADAENDAEPVPVSSEQEKMDQVIAELGSDIDALNNKTDASAVVDSEVVDPEPDEAEEVVSDLNNIIDELNDDDNDSEVDQNSEQEPLKEQNSGDQPVADLSSDAGDTDTDSDDFCVLDDDEIEAFDVETTQAISSPVIDDDVVENEDVENNIETCNQDSVLTDDKPQASKQVTIVNKPMAGKKAVVISLVFIVAFIAGWLINDMKFRRNQYIQAPENDHVENIYQSLPASDNSHPDDAILAKSLDEIDRIRNASIEKQKKIANLITYYKNSIHDLEIELINEKHEKNITSFQQVITNKKIELGLRTIQRRRTYIKNLKSPYEQLLLGIEELFYMKRKAEIDIQMIPFSTGIDISELEKNIHTVIQKHISNINNFKIDTENIQNIQFHQLETIWESLDSINPAHMDNNVFTPYDNKTIWEGICRGNFSRINLLTDLSSEAAACLSKWKGKDLYLNGLSTIRPDVVKNFISWKGEWICLNGLGELSPEIAKLLSQWKGKRLSLNGLTSLSGRSAAYLSKWKGNQMELVGINKLSADTLKYLSKWSKSGGTLYMDSKLLKRIK